jgi:hypothetical protein
MNWCAAQDSNLQHAALEATASADWATGAYPRQASNLHFPAFKAGPLPIGLRGQRKWCATVGHELASSRLDERGEFCKRQLPAEFVVGSRDAGR